MFYKILRRRKYIRIETRQATLALDTNYSTTDNFQVSNTECSLITMHQSRLVSMTELNGTDQNIGPQNYDFGRECEFSETLTDSCYEAKMLGHSAINESIPAVYIYKTGVVIS